LVDTKLLSSSSDSFPQVLDHSRCPGGATCSNIVKNMARRTHDYTRKSTTRGGARGTNLEAHVRFSFMCTISSRRVLHNIYFSRLRLVDSLQRLYSRHAAENRVSSAQAAVLEALSIC